MTEAIRSHFDPAAYKGKKEALIENITALTSSNTAVAFSGGADSSLLLQLAVLGARKNGTKVYAITAATELHPAGDIEAAKKIAAQLKADHTVIHIDELQDAGIQDNPPDRCYRCKRYLFTQMKNRAERLGASVVLEGTNYDDLSVYRPGIKALKEHGIISPLKDAGFTKQEVRRLAAEYGISAANKPAAPCLATRFPYHTRLDLHRLRQVEDGEKFLKQYDLYNVRLRVHDTVARIEVDEKDMPLIYENRSEIIRCLRSLGFDYITLDLAGFRSGSMDIFTEEN